MGLKRHHQKAAFLHSSWTDGKGLWRGRTLLPAPGFCVSYFPHCHNSTADRKHLKDAGEVVQEKQALACQPDGAEFHLHVPPCVCVMSVCICVSEYMRGACGHMCTYVGVCVSVLGILHLIISDLFELLKRKGLSPGKPSPFTPSLSLYS